MKNLLLVAYHFPPRGGTPVQRAAKFAKYLPQFGYRPVVLTSDYDDPRIDCDPTLLAGLEETAVFRCRGWESLVIGLPRRLKIHAITSFFLRPEKGVLAWNPSALRAARRIAARYPPSAVMTTVGPRSAVLLGAAIKKALGIPWIVDYRDPWTDDINAVWPTRLHYQFEVRQEQKALAAADAILVVTPTMQELLTRRYPQWAGRVHLIPNGYDRDDFPPRAAATPGPRLEIGHAGALFPYDTPLGHVRLGALVRLWMATVGFRLGETDLSTHSPYYLLHAVRALLDERPELADRLVVSFAGHFAGVNAALVQQLKLQHVVSRKGFLSHASCVEYLAHCDVLFLPLLSPPAGTRSYHLTGKVFEYLASGKPILAAVPDGDLRDLIERTRAGWCVDPKNVHGIKTLLRELIDRKAAGDLHLDRDEEAIGQFDRKQLTGKLASLLDTLT